MMHRKLLVPVVIVLLFLAAIFVRVKGYQGGEVDSTHAAALPYGIRGPHSVGIRELVIGGETPLEINEWYPTLENNGHEGEITYPYKMKLPVPLGIVSIANYKGQAVKMHPMI